MHRIVNTRSASRAARAYTSPLRDEQSDGTRRRILDALARTLARGVAELSVPAVAREAGVSVPTVYRHFPTKRRLVDALPAYVNERTGLADLPERPRDLAGLSRVVLDMFTKLEGMDETLRA